MKHLAAAALGFSISVVPCYAQQVSNAPGVAEALTKAYVDTWNTGDAAALSKLFVSSQPRYLPALGPVWESQEAIANGVARAAAAAY